MDWVARAKEVLLSVRTSQPINRTAATPKPVQWSDLSPLRAAINEALTGSPQTHPIALIAAEAALFRRYLVIADTGAEADEIQTALATLTPEAQATIRSLENDSSWVAGLVTGGPATIRYDAAFLSVSEVTPHGDALLRRVGSALDASGLLWLSSRATVAPSGHAQRLPEIILQHVPRRWRTGEALQTICHTHSRVGATDWIECLLRADFEIISQRGIGGGLLGPLLASGAISQEIASDAEGCEILRALYRVEQMLIESGDAVATDFISIARPHRPAADRIRQSFETELAPLPGAATAGISGDLPEWIGFNLGLALTSARAADHAAPFPPTDLMYHTTGLQQDRDFAQHGADILTALSAASPKPLGEFTSILDFGVGVGRVARYYKGFSGRYVGADIDEPNLAWVAGHLPWVETVLTEPAAPLPFEPATFDGVVSISVFTHIDRETTAFYVDELYRLTRPGALLFLTLHGDQALNLALSDAEVGRLIGISPERLEQARSELARDGFHFAEQYTHLTRTNYRYGTTFVSQQGAEAIFGRRFSVVGFVPGAIHAFQDLIVLERP